MYGIKMHTAVDFYKTGHPFMFLPGLEGLYANFTPRGDKYFAANFPNFDHKVLWVGFQAVLQGMLIEEWNNTFFNRPKSEVIDEYNEIMKEALGDMAPSSELLEDLHDLGYLPVSIKSLPEGVRVNLRVPTYTIKSTVKRHAWIVQYLEVQMSCESWPPMTAGTQSLEFRKLLLRYAIMTGSSLDFTKKQGHNFAMRGMYGLEASVIQGGAHLMVFEGTDTVPSISFVKRYWPDPAKPLIGTSIPATEHAVSSTNIIIIAKSLERTGSWNGWTKESLSPRLDSSIMEVAETAFLKWMLTCNKPAGFFSYVADTYDFWSVITTVAQHLKEDIMSRNGRVVFRPDSGDPYKIIVGDVNAPHGTPERNGAVETLWDYFGGTINKFGFKTIDTHVGLIYGDSISYQVAFRILDGLMKKGFAADNIVFGIGSFTFQFVTRDSLGTAIKDTYSIFLSEGYDIFKDPKTDSGLKKSAKGLLRVELKDNEYVLYDQQTEEQETHGELKEVFRDSKMIKMWTVTEVRRRIEDYLDDYIEDLKVGYVTQCTELS
jgi:nicotinamide phosphoribosyltransferase